MATAAARVLVVDDEEPLARLVANYLGRDGFEASVTADGAEAVRVARQEDPDVVILDLGLPGLDGVEVCRQLRTTRCSYCRCLDLPGRDGHSRGDHSSPLLRRFPAPAWSARTTGRRARSTPHRTPEPVRPVVQRDRQHPAPAPHQATSWSAYSYVIFSNPRPETAEVTPIYLHKVPDRPVSGTHRG